MSTKKDSLREILIRYSFNVPADMDLQALIAGMTADEIITAMEEAKIVNDKLKSTSLGRELG
jgi:hypothetical protein